MDLRSYITVPFKEKGRSKNGWDCWGVAYVMYKEFLNINLPLYLDDYVSTSEKDVLGILIEGQLEAMWQEVEKPAPFDIVNIRLQGRPMHIGVYIGSGRFIHALEKNGTVIERIDSIIWENRIVGYYRYVS